MEKDESESLVSIPTFCTDFHCNLGRVTWQINVNTWSVHCLGAQHVSLVFDGISEPSWMSLYSLFSFLQNRDDAVLISDCY